jgi:methionine aminopeptidase
MRSAGRIVAEILALLNENAAPGVTTRELDEPAGKQTVGYIACGAELCGEPWFQCREKICRPR